jgi:hypothetical protein
MQQYTIIGWRQNRTQCLALYKKTWQSLKLFLPHSNFKEPRTAMQQSKAFHHMEQFYQMFYSPLMQQGKDYLKRNFQKSMHNVIRVLK